MGLRDLDSIDIIHEPPPFETEPCKLILAIIDATDLDDATRYSLLVKKLTGYLAYVANPDFAQAHPGLTDDDVLIRILTVKPPSEAMRKIYAIKSPDESVRIRVFFDDYHQYMHKLRAGHPAPPSAN